MCGQIFGMSIANCRIYFVFVNVISYDKFVRHVFKGWNNFDKFNIEIMRKRAETRSTVWNRMEKWAMETGFIFNKFDETHLFLAKLLCQYNVWNEEILWFWYFFVFLCDFWRLFIWFTISEFISVEFWIFNCGEVEKNIFNNRRTILPTHGLMWESDGKCQIDAFVWHIVDKANTWIHNEQSHRKWCLLKIVKQFIKCLGNLV